MLYVYILVCRLWTKDLQASSICLKYKKYFLYGKGITDRLAKTSMNWI